MIQLREIYDKAITSHDPGVKWENVTGDAVAMTYLIKRLVGQVHKLNELGKHDMDLCPLCAGYTWGRPSENGSMDFTRRHCSDCGELRPEPKGADK